MDSNDALSLIETKLRALVRAELTFEAWWFGTLKSSERSKIESSMRNEQKLRVGAVVSSDHLDYTELRHLHKIIGAHWAAFEDVLDDRAQFDALMALCIPIRIAMSHSRELLPFERELLSGFAGRLANQVALKRAGVRDGQSYYPLIERLTDQTGRVLKDGPTVALGPGGQTIRLGRFEMNDTVVLRAKSTPVRGRELRWAVNYGIPLPYVYDPTKYVAGADVEIPLDIGTPSEGASANIILFTDSEYHRNGRQPITHGEPWDDHVSVSWATNPPMHE